MVYSPCTNHIHLFCPWFTFCVSFILLFYFLYVGSTYTIILFLLLWTSCNTISSLFNILFHFFSKNSLSPAIFSLLLLCLLKYLTCFTFTILTPGGGNDNPLQYSCLENPMDWGAWQATVYGVTKSRTWQRNQYLGFPSGSDRKESTCNVGDLDSIPGSRRSLGEENDYLFQYSCLKNPMNRGACQATVYGVTKSWTRLSD